MSEQIKRLQFVIQAIQLQRARALDDAAAEAAAAAMLREQLAEAQARIAVLKIDLARALIPMPDRVPALGGEKPQDAVVKQLQP